MPDKSNKKKGKKPLPADAAGPVTVDPRFAKVHQDPRFARPKKDANKVKIDKRFEGMLKNAEFGSGVAAPKVDKYGRKKQTTTAKELERFYKLDEEEDNDSEGTDDEDESGDGEDVLTAQEESDKKFIDFARGGGDVESSDEEQGDDDEEEEDEEDQLAGYDLARGEVVVESSDEDEDGGFGDDSAEDEDETAVGPYAEDNVPTGEETHRFAVVNLDWDHVKAKDLYKVFDGFKPPSGTLRSVKIYPSEFGKQRMETEAREGPPKEIFGSTSDDEDLSKPLIRASDGDDFDNTKLRKYQLERLKYYYAVVECDSVSTARSLYKTCDGAEFEKSANFFDLRYIPDGMEFEDAPSDEAYETPQAYQPVDFVTLALQHSNVKLTWDEDDHERTKLTRRKFTKEDLKDMDFKAYLASDSESEEEESAGALRSKYQSLLAGDDADSDADAFDSKSNKNEEMEITFAPGLSEKAAQMLEKKKEREQREGESVFDAYLRRRKEKKKERKAGLKRGDEEEDEEGLESDEGSMIGDESDGGVEEGDDFFNVDFGDEYEPKKGKAKAATKPTKSSKKPAPEPIDPKQKEQLELLFMDDNQDSRHFEMKEVLQAEKQKGKRKRGKKGKKGEEANGGAVQDGFEVDVADPRFSNVLGDHEFAIDPTNPNFKKTSGMKKLLDVRRSKFAGDGDVQMGEASGSKKDKPEPTASAAKTNLSQLVDSVKRKSESAMGGGKGKRQKTGR
ncbi:pre-rRNA-processing protein esf1 [Rhizophlyctis rosea]|uniref:Pre-rRNA-processing protein esf1 n=1 Tax=Rhizophlyctis rosea TaxID=64517 RepID=A0AAD5SLJ5_9FUNG|nr:pre-rRNA-processing protein esf1 [Rhizophlyctis rosea]